MSDARRKTVIVRGASQGIGAGAAMAFLKLGYNVVANSRKISESGFAADPVRGRRRAHREMVTGRPALKDKNNSLGTASDGSGRSKTSGSCVCLAR